jgi:hypothetical protein
LASIVLMQIANLIGRRSRYRSGLDRELFRNPLILSGIVNRLFLCNSVLAPSPESVGDRTRALVRVWIGLAVRSDFVRNRFGSEVRGAAEGETSRSHFARNGTSIKKGSPNEPNRASPAPYVLVDFPNGRMRQTLLTLRRRVQAKPPRHARLPCDKFGKPVQHLLPKPLSGPAGD